MAEFREKRDRSLEAHRAKSGVDALVIDAASLMEWDNPRPEHGDTWGNWRYDAKKLVLTHIPQDYEIDLEDCSTSAKTLDWIFQMESKVWMTHEDKGNLLDALDDLIDPQATLCSGGANKTLDVKKHLTAKA